VRIKLEKFGECLYGGRYLELLNSEAAAKWSLGPIKDALIIDSTLIAKDVGPCPKHYSGGRYLLSC